MSLQWSYRDDDFYPSSSVYDISYDTQGNVYLSGIYNTPPGYQAGIIKFNYDGEISWSTSFNNLETYDHLNMKTVVTGSDNIYVAANTSSWDWSLLRLIKISQTGEDAPNQSIANLEIKQNFPNPFNNQTTILYRIPQPTHVTLKIYDLNGRKVFNDDLGQRANGRIYLFHRLTLSGQRHLLLPDPNRLSGQNGEDGSD